MDFTMPVALLEMQREMRGFVLQELQPLDDEVERSGEIPAGALAGAGKRGLFGTTTPLRYGGLGLGMLANCLVVEELAQAHIAFFYTISMNIHIASKGILFDGSEEQRQKYLPVLASGERLGAYALTEPNAGSDAAALETSARREGDHFVLNGRKRFITNGPIADIYTVFASTDRALGARGITAFVVERGTPGLSAGRVFRMCGGHGAQHSEIIFEECMVPAANVIGAVGRGFRTAMRCLDDGRLNWAAYSVGSARRLLELSVDHLRTRRQFGRTLGANQGLQWQMADLAVELHAARLVAHEAAWRYDRGEMRAGISARAKLYCAEMVWRVADWAMQVHGGLGYTRDLPVERIWREVRAIRILEGTSEIMRHIVAREMLQDGSGPESRLVDPG